MKVLILSLDKTLLGASGGGDAQERHKQYGDFVDKIDIIIFSRAGFKENKISDKVTAFPTNSFSKANIVFDAYKIGKELFKLNNYDLIDTQDPFFTGLVGRLLKMKFQKPLEVHFHGDFWGNSYQSEANLFQLLLSKFVARKADGIRVVSSGIKEKLIKKGIASEKIEVIPTPVDLEKFKKFKSEKVEEIKNIYSNKKIILYVGRLVKVKNLPMLLNAVALVKRTMPDIVLLLIGSGNEKQELERLSKKINIGDIVKFINSLPQEELANYYRAADVFVLPSFSESLGKVLIEAGSAGCPIVATNTTGAKDIIIDSKTGFLTPIDDTPLFAEKILKVLRLNESEKQDMAKNTEKQLEEKFNGQKNIQKIIAFWKKIAMLYV